MRPKNSKDLVKRKRKTILNGAEERLLICDYENNIGVGRLCKKYNVTKSYISNMFKNRNIKKKIYLSAVKLWETIDIKTFKQQDVSGVYAIYFVNKSDYNDIKIYIGSSVNIVQRLRDHHRELTKDVHASTLLLEYFNNPNYLIHYAIIEKCADDLILQKEAYYLHSYNQKCLLNQWKPTKKDDLVRWLERAITNDSYAKNYTINPTTGCKESNCVHKSGYGRMMVTLDGLNSQYKGQTKYFYKHRVAYWEKTGEYPELIRHKCHNPACYNADHLESGSYRDNSLDKRKDFPEIFEQKWVAYGGDLVKLTEYFKDRWMGNQLWHGKKVSFAIYSWEKKLKLREKYPDIVATRKRRYNIKN